MRFGCSECLCIAIESHRQELLELLLRSPDVMYRDMYWAPTPRDWQSSQSTFSKTEIPVLHYIQADSDLSFVGRENCGHMRVDVELSRPFDETYWNPSGYILVSLPLIARWHSTHLFDAEQILLQSAKFSYSEPQFYHVVRKYSGFFAQTRGPLNHLNLGVQSAALVLRCEFEIESSSKAVHFPRSPAISSVLRRQSSSHPHQMVTVWIEFLSEFNIFFYKLFGPLARLLHEARTCNAHHYASDGGSVLGLGLDPSRFLCELRRLLSSGADLNDMLFAQVARRYESYRPTALHYDLLADWCWLLRHMWSARDSSISVDQLIDYFRLLLRHGLAFFYGDLSGRRRLDVFESLICDSHYLPEAVRRGIARQLLALGYGRRELHPGDLPIRDEKLVVTRLAARNRRREADEHTSRYVYGAELQSLIERFDSGPLSLQELARIAVRRAVGGVHFERRIGAIVQLIPPSLFEYVAEANEMLNC